MLPFDGSMCDPVSDKLLDHLKAELRINSDPDLDTTSTEDLLSGSDPIQVCFQFQCDSDTVEPVTSS